MKVFPFTVTNEDVQEGNPNKPFSCALAVAITRTAKAKMPTVSIGTHVSYETCTILIRESWQQPKRRVPLVNTQAMNRFQKEFDAGNITYLDEPLHFRPKQRWT